MIIAIDGPAASGKGTLGKRLARHYGYRHLDTGVIYRAVAKAMLDAGADLTNEVLAVSAALELDPEKFGNPALKTQEVGDAASVVSAFPGVREVLLNFQRQFAADPPGAVLDGRDIGTVICPDADVKIFVVADARVRARLVRHLAILYRDAKQYPAAIDAFRQYATIETDDDGQVEAAAQIVDTDLAAGDLAAAEREAQAGTKKFADNRGASCELQLALAEVYEQSKHWNEMMKALDRADQFASTGREKEQAYFMRGAGLERQKQFDQSEAAFRKVLELNPKNAGALNYLGYMLADRNVRLEEAYDLIKRAVDLEPDNGAYLDSLGWVYFRQGKLDDARGLLERALERMPDPTVRDHLGDVYLKLGKTKEAIAQWQDSLREFQKAAQQEADPEEMASVNRKLDEAQAKLAAETHAK